MDCRKAGQSEGQSECAQHWDLKGGHGKGRSIMEGVELNVPVGNKVKERDMHRL